MPGPSLPQIAVLGLAVAGVRVPGVRVPGVRVPGVRISGVRGLLAAGLLAALASGAVAQVLPRPDVPMGIMCFAQKNKSWHAAYLDAVEENGDALYISLGSGGRLTVRLNAAGVLVAPSQNPNRIDCFGQTVDELRTNGRLIEAAPLK